MNIFTLGALVEIRIGSLRTFHLTTKPNQSSKNDGKCQSFQNVPDFRERLRLIDTLEMKMPSRKHWRTITYDEFE